MTPNGDHPGRSRDLWPDPDRGPYLVETYWRSVQGHLECVGLRLSSFDDGLGEDGIRPAVDRYERVRPSQLREVPWGEILDRYRRQNRDTGALLGMAPAEREAAAERLIAQGIDPETASIKDWLAATPRAVQERALARQPMRAEPQPRASANRGGRPPLHTEEDWRRRALIYLDAVGRGEPPNAVVAREEQVSIATARTWAAMLRKKGLLPKPAGPGRPSDPRFQEGS